MDLLKNNFTSLVNDEFVRPEVLNSVQKQDTPQIQVSRFTNTVSKISSEKEKKDNSDAEDIIKTPTNANPPSNKRKRQQRASATKSSMSFGNGTDCTKKNKSNIDKQMKTTQENAKENTTTSTSYKKRTKKRQAKLKRKIMEDSDESYEETAEKTREKTTATKDKKIACPHCNKMFSACGLGGHKAKAHPGLNTAYRNKMEVRKKNYANLQILREAQRRIRKSLNDPNLKNAELPRSMVEKHKGIIRDEIEKGVFELEID